MEHNHEVGDERYYSDCPACRLEQAAPALLEALVAAVEHENHEDGKCGCCWTLKADAAIALTEKGK
ncbi:MAG TPA: hypothetical protein VMW16_00105 [Sedimentisphaerales bacterium]|nr:hypothetical protein [Sedimentisphaerales bacterium]